MLKQLLNNHMPQDAEGLRETLVRLDWKRLGGSVAGTTVVMAPSSDAKMVLRVSPTGDQGFANYAELCLLHDSSHMQRVSWHEFLADGTHVALTEKLHPLYRIEKMPPALKTQLHSLRTIERYYMSGLTSEDTYDKEKLSELFSKLQEASPKLHNCVVLLQQCMNVLYARSIHYTMPEVDLLPPNIMIRKDEAGDPKTIVISDPFSFDPTFDERENSDLANHNKLKSVFGLPPQAFARHLT